MKENQVIEYIVNWLKNYKMNSSCEGFILGVSGGIDSALTSTLVAKTGDPTLCVEMPIHQNSQQIDRSKNHIKWLKNNHHNVTNINTNLTKVFELFQNQTISINSEHNDLALANTRARLRMMNIYYYAQLYNYLVVGTGNKIEDFGIGFFTKYGDGGVDISPIADLLKSEVYNLSKYLKINNEIIIAPPTDGLWDDNKSDEDQIGASYAELEWAMNYKGSKETLNKRELKVLKIYKSANIKNQHKMKAIPVCKIPDHLR